MSTTSQETVVPTRREMIKGSGALVGGGLLTGCAGESGPGDGMNGSNNSQSGKTTTNGGSGNSSSVTMAPVGEVEFGRVPENVMAYAINSADSTVALGHGDAVNSVWGKETIGPTLEYYYSALDGVSFDWGALASLTEVGGSTIAKESFYELNSDVHFLDPCYLSSFKGWSKSDIREIEENIGPCFGNHYSRKHTQPPERCRGGYRYYPLWKLVGKFAQVFRESKRYEALAHVHETLTSHIQTTLPAKNHRPTVGMAYPRFSESQPSFYVHQINSPGYFWAHTRPMKAIDAFADIEMADEYGGQLVDYEAMLEADPDVILLNHGITPFYDVAEVKKKIRNHTVGRKLTAVKTDCVYASVNPRQGPIMHLFNLEMTAKQLYPDQFGEWPGYVDDEPYPEIPKNEQLFDRQRVANISNGNI